MASKWIFLRKCIFRRSDFQPFHSSLSWNGRKSLRRKINFRRKIIFLAIFGSFLCRNRSKARISWKGRPDLKSGPDLKSQTLNYQLRSKAQVLLYIQMSPYTNNPT